MPKLSIITVNFNNAEGLQRTIKSVLEQQYENLEFIVIDGNSTDSSLQVIKEYEANITQWISEPDTGAYNAMNKGISLAKGKYVLFLNSGDYFYASEVLKENNFNFSESDLICFDIEVLGSGKSFIKKHPDELRLSYLFNKTFAHQSTLIKRTLFDRVGFYDESLKIVADWKFFIHATVHFRCTYKAVHNVLSVYNLDGMSATAKGTFTRRSEREKILNDDFSLFLEDYQNLKKLETNRFKILDELENSKFCQKINSGVLRFLLRVFRNKGVKNL